MEKSLRLVEIREDEGKRSDSQLVALTKGGNEEAFLELVERYTEKVQHLAMRITRSEQDAEEVVQEVFITLFTKIKTFRGTSAFSSWLYRVTSNAAFMKLRNRRKHSASSYEEVTENGGSCESVRQRSDSSDVNYISTRHELRQLIEEAIEALPSEYRSIFVLRDVDGLSNHEVGEVLGLSVPAVKSRLHRARLMLRKKLQRYYQDYYDADVLQLGSESTGWNGMDALKAA
ncbi:MAG: sigma-70 family RNA polymerase sigma factor [Bdellovibrionales bacterium]|nr:sigma-70 family RNA polymerase sigma factor [Bdellovibrionales bacterium]